MRIIKRIKKKYEEFLENLIKANKENFDGQRLECCDLNKTRKKKKKQIKFFAGLFFGILKC